FRTFWRLGGRGSLGDWRLGFVLSLLLFDIDDDEGICGRFGRFDGGPDAYRPTSFGDDVGESFTVLRLRYFGD
ncbi:hypothetical protein LAZ29_00630, partial [Cereibacter sphaeroides]|uniref:hypothetical protein n=1 Tax=Cereibacter sphaeroides TaxID=1063 RepID=UPI001F35E126